MERNCSGQKLAVEAHFLGHKGMAQKACLELMVNKIAVSKSTSGDMPETGVLRKNRIQPGIEGDVQVAV
jgi:hypothetical protein